MDCGVSVWHDWLVNPLVFCVRRDAEPVKGEVGDPVLSRKASSDVDIRPVP